MKGREIARKGSELEQAGVEELREELAWSKVEVAKLKDVINRAQRDNLSTEGTTAAPLSTANQSKVCAIFKQVSVFQINAVFFCVL